MTVKYCFSDPKSPVCFSISTHLEYIVLILEAGFVAHFTFICKKICVFSPNVFIMWN